MQGTGIRSHIFYYFSIFILSSSCSSLSFFFLRITRTSRLLTSFTITTSLFCSLWIARKSHFFNLILATSSASSTPASRSSLWMSSGRQANTTHSLLEYCFCSANLFSISTALSINLSLLFLSLMLFNSLLISHISFCNCLMQSLSATSLCLWKLTSSISCLVHFTNFFLFDWVVWCCSRHCMIVG